MTKEVLPMPKTERIRRIHKQLQTIRTILIAAAVVAIVFTFGQDASMGQIVISLIAMIISVVLAWIVSDVMSDLKRQIGISEYDDLYVIVLKTKKECAITDQSYHALAPGASIASVMSNLIISQGSEDVNGRKIEDASGSSRGH